MNPSGNFMARTLRPTIWEQDQNQSWLENNLSQSILQYASKWYNNLTYNLTAKHHYVPQEGLWQFLNITVPPESMKTLSTSLWTNVVAADEARRSSSSYKMIIFPTLFFCGGSQGLKKNDVQGIEEFSWSFCTATCGRVQCILWDLHDGYHRRTTLQAHEALLAYKVIARNEICCSTWTMAYWWQN